jgi:ribose 5-phosphate isomerase B
MTPVVRIALGSDHAGFERKEVLKKFLGKAGYPVLDLGCHSEERCDYPDYARRVSEAVVKGRADKGVLTCGTGIGMAIAANKVRGIRAAVAWSPLTGRMASQHNWANVLCLPGRILTDLQAQRILKAWLETEPEGGRHKRRIDKISKLDARRCP